MQIAISFLRRLLRSAQWSACLALAASLLVSIAGLSAQQPMLVPQPRELKTTAQAFKVTSRLRIVLLAPFARADFFAAEQVREELQFATGRRFPIVRMERPPMREPAIIMGRIYQPEMRRLLEARGLSIRGIGRQGYVLDVGPRNVIVAGRDHAGLFYGVQTLRQLVVPTGPDPKRPALSEGGRTQARQAIDRNAEIPGVRIRDWPALEFRGTQVDMSRGPVPRLSYLEKIVRTIAQFKINQLYMYMEDSFRLKGQPLWGVLSDTLTREDWEKLVAYAATYHVEIVPESEACGHLHKILRFEQYSGLAERPHGSVLAPEDPHMLGFLNAMYEQMAAVFPSSIYNIGCDETFELGRGRTKQLVQQEGYGKVYVDNLIRIARLVERYHKKVMFWGDIATEHPEMISSLPGNLIVASWEYAAHKSYMKWLKPFEGTGMKIFVCPWVGNTSVMVPDYEEAAYNIARFLADGKKAGAVGAIITVWNDDGETLYSPGWWSIVYGAACAWESGTPSVKEFNQKFDWAFFRDADPSIVNSMMSLGHLNEVMRAGKPVDTFDMHYGGAGDLLFWRDPFSPIGQQEVQKELPVASLIRQTAEAAYTVFADSSASVRRNASALASLKFAALRLDALGMRYQYAREISDRYLDALSQEKGKHRGLVYPDLSDISSINGRLQDLRDYTTRLTEMYRKLWLSENLPHWMPNILQLYYRNSALWQNLIARYTDIRTDFSQGQPLPSPDSLGLLPAQQDNGKSDQ